MNACSFGKQTFSPLTGFDLPDDTDSDVGVWDVTVPAASNSASDIANAVTALLYSTFETLIPLISLSACHVLHA